MFTFSFHSDSSKSKEDRAAVKEKIGEVESSYLESVSIVGLPRIFSGKTHIKLYENESHDPLHYMSIRVCLHISIPSQLDDLITE